MSSTEFHAVLRILGQDAEEEDVRHVTAEPRPMIPADLGFGIRLKQGDQRGSEFAFTHRTAQRFIIQACGRRMTIHRQQLIIFVIFEIGELQLKNVFELPLSGAAQVLEAGGPPRCR